jgi:hypothetical protein
VKIHAQLRRGNDSAKIFSVSHPDRVFRGEKGTFLAFSCCERGGEAILLPPLPPKKSSGIVFSRSTKEKNNCCRRLGGGGGGRRSARFSFSVAVGKDRQNTLPNKQTQIMLKQRINDCYVGGWGGRRIWRSLPLLSRSGEGREYNLFKLYRGST